MSDQVEKKLQHVAIASYEYRHDAEFAAGFLDDAGIPFYRRTRAPGDLTLGMADVAPIVGEEHLLFVPAGVADEARKVLDETLVEVDDHISDDDDRRIRRNEMALVELHDLGTGDGANCGFGARQRTAVRMRFSVHGAR